MISARKEMVMALNNVELDNVKGITYYKINGNKYISTRDLEDISGLKRGSVRGWKHRRKMIEDIDYIMLDNKIMINIESEFIKNKIKYMTIVIHIPY